MRRNVTRDELVRVGGEIIAQQGFNPTGINAVLSTAEVPKGSFYHYFSSKEDFGLAVIDELARDYAERLDGFFTDEQVSPLDRIRNYLDDGIKTMADTQCTRGCPIGNLSLELAGQNETFRLRLEAVFRTWEKQFAGCLRQARDAGQIAADSDVERLANMLLTGWEGAILRAKVTKSVEPMRAFSEVLFASVLKPPVAG